MIAFTMFTLQQWSGQVSLRPLPMGTMGRCFDRKYFFHLYQNSIGYYAPQVFESIGIGGTNTTLFASGIYGLVKVIATIIFLFVGIEQFGRKRSLMGAFISLAISMPTFHSVFACVLIRGCFSDEPVLFHPRRTVQNTPARR